MSLFNAWRKQSFAVAACLTAVLCISATAFAQRYSQTNLVSDIPGLAAVTDPHLVNAWGIAFTPASPFWIADNGTGFSTLYNGAGVIIPLVVTIPPPTGSTDTAAPTGIVFNGTGGFTVTANGLSGSALFIFVTEDGTISGWAPGVDLTHAIRVVDNSGAGAVYKGLAIAQTDSGAFLYATNFHDGTIEMYDTHFTWQKSFTDSDLPTRFAPFGIRAINGKLYITFARQDKDKHDDFSDPNQGFVDVFDTDGNKLQRLASRQGLNSPWGLALAPASFGKFANDLLVGNFGDGTISAFDPQTGKLLGQLQDANGNVLKIDGLWALAFGNGGQAGSPNDLFFTAGPDDESHGLFGKLTTIQ